MKTILLLLIFTGKIGYSQDLEKIKKADTIYIYFKEDKTKQIHHNETSRNKDKKYDVYFFVYLNDNVYFEFTNLKTINNNIRKRKKKFLKKNKDLILNYNFIKKTGCLYIAELTGYNFDAKKTIYVIDEKNIGCFKITLKQVRVVGPLRSSIE